MSMKDIASDEAKASADKFIRDLENGVIRRPKYPTFNMRESDLDEDEDLERAAKSFDSGVSSGLFNRIMKEAYSEE
jgi:hypothetical protein